jgi:hypothetical protein
MSLPFINNLFEIVQRNEIQMAFFSSQKGLLLQILGGGRPPFKSRPSYFNPDRFTLRYWFFDYCSSSNRLLLYTDKIAALPTTAILAEDLFALLIQQQEAQL